MYMYSIVPSFKSVWWINSAAYYQNCSDYLCAVNTFSNLLMVKGGWERGKIHHFIQWATEMPNFGRKFRQKFGRNCFRVQISFLCVRRKFLFREKDVLSAKREAFAHALLPRPFCKRTSIKSITTSLSFAEIHNMHQYLLESEKNCDQ